MLPAWLALMLAAGGSCVLAGCGSRSAAAPASAPAGGVRSSETRQPHAEAGAKATRRGQPSQASFGPPSAAPVAASPDSQRTAPHPADGEDDGAAPPASAATSRRGASEGAQLDDGKIAAAGIRKVEGKHLTLYTDLEPAAEIDALPALFDAAVPLWCDYFGIDRQQTADWHMIGSVMRERERFLGAGLLPASLPDFPNGYARGSRLWLYDQPSDYYRRHLLLHEGTHAFMDGWLGGAGPPWYMEGMAELLGTHRWAAGRLELAWMPPDKNAVPYWGRVKTVREEWAAGRGMTLEDIFRYDARAHLKQEPYAWCWAAAAFLDQHPLTQAAFRELKGQTRDRSDAFSRRFREHLADDWPQIARDWQLFVIECDYGYDVARAAVVEKQAVELPSDGATVSVAADRGWQSSGLLLQGGKTYRLTATGRFQVAGGPPPWPCEAGGVTIRYANGRPLGMLIAGVADPVSASPTPLATPTAIGLGGTIAPPTTGTLYLKINEPASGLADNQGALRVRVEAQ